MRKAVTTSSPVVSLSPQQLVPRSRVTRAAACDTLPDRAQAGRLAPRAVIAEQQITKRSQSRNRTPDGLLAAACLTEKPHQGFAAFARTLHQAIAFSKPLSASGFDVCLYDSGRRSRCTGKERDAETGLDYFGARYMSSAQGRFLSIDPSYESEILEYPQTWNRYTYVYNRPLNLTDPDGRCPNCVTALVGAGVGAVVEGGIDLGVQLYQNGGHLNQVSWGEVGAHAGGGAVTGGLAGFTLGGSVLVDVAVGATSTAIGGMTTREIEHDFVAGMADEDPLNGEQIAGDLAAGALGGYVGHRAADLIHLPGTGPRPRPGRNFRTRFAKYNDRVAKQSSVMTRAFAVGTAVSQAASDAFWSAMNWLTVVDLPAQYPKVDVTIHYGCPGDDKPEGCK
jgi:RHS repeat-associated protein